jgi:hypothetical protein
MRAIAGPEEQQFYESSNGDVWYLGSDSLSGARDPPAESEIGRQSISIDVHKFLLESPTEPLHQALRTPMGASYISHIDTATREPRSLFAGLSAYLLRKSISHVSAARYF